MDAIDLLGYLAAALLIAAFSSRAMVPLRAIAVAGCGVLVAFALIAETWPILALSGVLLAINVFRLWQSRWLLRKVKDASPAGLRFDLMIPGMERVVARRGQILFSKGDAATAVYYILSGAIKLVDHGTVLRKGEIFGEMAMFTVNGRRTDTAICATDAELATIDESTVWRALQDSPEFGLYLIQRLVERSNAPGAVRADSAGAAARMAV
jgi:CRP/FNR family transcriptional regulator, cyclic AMP receptor protein